LTRQHWASLSAPAGRGLVLAAVVILSLLWFLSWDRSLIGDEALTIAIARGTMGSLIEQVCIDIHMPGYYVLLWLWIRAFGPVLVSIRIFALLPAIALVVLSGRRISRGLMLLLCCSPFLLHLSIELRMYGLLALAGGVILHLLRRVDESRSRGRFALLVVACCLSVWIHFFAWPGVAASAALLLYRRRFRDCAILTGCALLSIFPWISQIPAQMDGFIHGMDYATLELTQRAGFMETLAGFPLSIAGTLLRFSSGTCGYSFGLFSVRSLEPWAALGFVLFAVFIAAAVAGVRRAGAPAVFILLCTLPLGLLRPSARHFAIAFPAFLLLVASGLGRPGRPWKVASVFSVVLSIILCLRFSALSILPQRCIYDRDAQEAAEVAGGAASDLDLPMAVYLDNYTTLALLYHLGDIGYGGLTVWHPHTAMFSRGIMIYNNPAEATAYLLHDTDSLFADIEGRLGGRFVLVANDPTVVGGPPYGSENRLLGRGSDMMSDEDLMEVLLSRGTLTKLDLPGSEGPFSAFVFESREAADGLVH